MAGRKEKYIKVINFTHFIKSNSNNILLFVHINNLNIVESTFTKIYTEQHHITNYQIPSNLVKRISTNENFCKVVGGPTKIFAFNSFSSLFYFCKEKYVTQKVIPLAIFWNNNFFCYKFFMNYIKDYFLNDLEILSLNSKQHFLLKFLHNNSKININFIQLQQKLLKQFINILFHINGQHKV